MNPCAESCESAPGGPCAESRFADVQRRIAEAAVRAGRDASDVTLVAVPKTHCPAASTALTDSGGCVFETATSVTSPAPRPARAAASAIRLCTSASRPSTDGPPGTDSQPSAQGFMSAACCPSDFQNARRFAHTRNSALPAQRLRLLCSAHVRTSAHRHHRRQRPLSD